MNKPIIIMGSARSVGQTRTAIETIIGDTKIPFVDLHALNITPFDYEHNNEDDDYIPLMERVTEENDLIILATPVYWYSMSTVMKIFIDRVSDLLSIRKDLGRKLRGKKIFVVASFSTSLPKGFEYPFSQTCEYLGIEYRGCSFIYHGSDEQLLEGNKDQIAKAQKELGVCTKIA
jgi:putative NADPH-quinone reductase